ncbi:amino acid--tRNA ligase-related protein [Myxococcota bacterium]
MPLAILAPSDLGRRVHRRSSQVTVGGRVVGLEGRELRLADALSQVRVICRHPVLLSPGDLAVVEGELSGAEITNAQILQHFGAPEPRHSSEFARLNWRGVGSRLVARDRALRAIRTYFHRSGFCEVDTPLLGPSPGFDLHVEGLQAEGGWLATSPEQAMKRLLVGGLPRVFQLCHTFRADERGAWHQPEFLLLEWYRAFADVECVIRDTEQVVLRAVSAVCGTSELVLPDGRKLSVTPPFPRVTVAEAFRQYADVRNVGELAEQDEGQFFELLVARVEPALAAYSQPVLLWQYPVSQAALARPSPSDPTVAERFELYAGGVELCNGFGELTDLQEHERRHHRLQAERRRLGRRPQPVDKCFLAAVREGLPPSAGNALGVDRLIALATGAATLAQVQPLAPP